MGYRFPIIKHINDILPAIEGRTDFHVVQKDGHQIVNYVVLGKDSFPKLNHHNKQTRQFSRIRRECRGLVFCSETGNILRRTPHKFMNINERPETQKSQLNFKKPHVVLTKMDGSLMAPFMLRGEIRFAHRFNIADDVDNFAKRNPQYLKFSEYCISRNITPYFEFCTPNNRIVLLYPEERLVFLGCRDMFTGKYIDLYDVAESMGIDVVERHPPVTNIDEFIKYTRGLVGTEGFVIQWADGTMVKLKADDYVLNHTSADEIMFEKNIVLFIVTNKLDDLLPKLVQHDRDAVEQFRDKFNEGIDATIKKYVEYFETVKHMTKKEWAQNHEPTLDSSDPYMKIAIYGLFNGKNVRDGMYNYIERKSHSTTTIDDNRQLWGGHVWSRTGHDWGNGQ